jgi:hypothetical protein
MDVAIPSDRNVTQKETENKLKYKNRSRGIQRMCSMKSFLIPVVIGTTATVTKGLKSTCKNTSKAFNRFSTKKKKKKKKRAVLGASHTITKVLSGDGDDDDTTSGKGKNVCLSNAVFLCYMSRGSMLVPSGIRIRYLLNADQEW